MPYHVIVQFDIPAQHRLSFIAFAQQDARDSLAGEPGTLQFEIIEGEAVSGRFYFHETYSNKAAFEAHCQNQPFKHFFESISSFAPEPIFLGKGQRIDVI